MNKCPFLIYCHIEKNAGTTVHYILNENLPFYLTLNSYKKYGNNRPFDAKALDKLLRLTKNKIQGIGGHTIYPYFDYEYAMSARQKCFVFTFLRDPIKRYLSHLNYRIIGMKQNWDLNSFLECDEFSDFQTKKIAGTNNVNTAIEILRNKFSFVGFIERFDEGLLMLKQFLGTDIDIHYQKQNVINKEKQPYTIDKLTDKEINAIRSVNEKDIQLYEFVQREIYQKQLSLYRGNLKEDISIYDMENKDYRFKYRTKAWFKLKNQISKFILQPITLNN